MADFKTTFPSLLAKAAAMKWERVDNHYYAEELDINGEELYRCFVPIKGQNASICIHLIETNEDEPRFALAFECRVGTKYHFIHRGQFEDLREQIELSVSGEHRVAEEIDNYLENL